jgi:hypothetical protein
MTEPLREPGHEPGGGSRVWSWAASDAEAEARCREADQLVAQRLRVVRYFMIDYRRHELRPELIDSGPRLVDDEVERREPTWRENGFDALDYGLELVTDSGTTFSLTWDPPGSQEGIGLQPVPMLGSGVHADADVAIWDVGDCTPSWAPMIGGLIVGVDLHYTTWDAEEGPLWCPRVTIHGERGDVEIVMGDVRGEALVPSADNVAVLHPGTPLPDWHIS